MPSWAWALQLAVGLLQDIAPEIEKAIALVTSAGGDPTPHQNAQAALSNSINDLSQVVAAIQTKP
jgi:hypothetical protein